MEDKPVDPDDLLVIADAHERARVIIDQHTSGMLQGDVPAEAGVLLSSAVVALVQLLQTGEEEHETSEKRCITLMGERDVAMKRARAAEAEQLPPLWYWAHPSNWATARLVQQQELCRAPRTGGDLQMIGQIPDQVQTACLARRARIVGPTPAG